MPSDLLPRVALSDAFKARRANKLYDEWIGSRLRDRPDIQAERLTHTRELMNRAVPDCLVIEYEPFIEQLTLPDPDDRHVLAAAIRCQAGVIVTLNVRDFPDELVARYGISVQHPDEFLTQLFDLKPAVVCTSVREMRASLANPPKTSADTSRSSRCTAEAGGVNYALRRVQEIGSGTLSGFRDRYKAIRPHWALEPAEGGDVLTPEDVYTKGRSGKVHPGLARPSRVRRVSGLKLREINRLRDCFAGRPSIACGTSK